jgi:hypothetical protein
MLNMRIKIDVWTKGMDEGYREKIRENLRSLFCQLPARRVWYYLKRIRWMLLNGAGREDNLQLEPSLLVDGPEDVVVDGKYSW